MQNLIQKQNKKDPKKTEKRQDSSKNFNMIISIIMAAVLWLYVLGEVNPETSVLIKSVNVQLLNVESLQDEALTFAEDQEYTVDVRIRGKRSEVSKVAAANISAVADLSGVKRGENHVPVSATVPQGVVVDQILPENLTIHIEKIIKITKPIHIQYTGVSIGEKEAEVIAFEPNKIALEGAESAINAVDKVIASVDLSKITQDISMELSLSPVDAEGNLVQGVLMEKASVSTEIALLTVKEIPFKVVIHEGAGPSDDLRVRLETYPETVKVKGRPDDLNGVEVIESMAVDTSLITASKELDLALNLPNGIYLSRSNPSLKASFIVEKLETKTLSWSAKDIEVKGLADGLECVMPEVDIAVHVKDSAAGLGSIDENTITLSVDVATLSEGRHSVGIISNIDKTVNVLIDPDHIEIDIKKKE